ncbi:MAG: thymidylate synthase [Sphingomonadaceae bacterium]|uniref:thymidylate synthase n=1 Tax=Thermaurantiacus sp. TaxID=2820283 RepID=UPI00298F1D52|nr:thymidylate synthase [Thermaurantiacus sp.]MCS6987721.1 thymidylate synthase [Sphingomonadaceae bacterium]MDW8415059.1 thymidylate synthase [Thermaurantiacus sp.]
MTKSWHPEQPILDLIRRVWTEGVERRDRTGVGTRALFGATLRFDLSGGTVPLMTTKRVYWKTAVKELLWFLSGETNIRPLVAQGVHIWTDWPLARYRAETGEAIDRDAFEARILADDDFARAWGDLGPVYGRQWRRWQGADGREHDQVAALVDGLRRNPAGRRHLLSGWNVADLDRMALPPCHMTYQYFVAEGRLSGILYQRSCDLGLGFPFNIFEAALLLRMLAQQCDLEPGELVWMGADVHLYLNHAHLVDALLARPPRPWPKLRLVRRPPDIFGYRPDDVVVDGYDPHPAILAPVAV